MKKQFKILQIRVLVVVLALYISFGMVLFLNIMQMHLYKTNLEKLPEQKAILELKFTENQLDELIWKKKKEFIYKNSFYDVISFTKRNDTIIYKCVIDIIENNIVKTFANYNGNEKSNKNSSKNYFKSFNINFFFTEIKNNFKIKESIIDISDYLPVNYSYQLIHQDFHPPKKSLQF